jgi:hypothetical protein
MYDLHDHSNGVLALLRLVFKGTIMNYKPRSCHTVSTANPASSQQPVL